MLRAVRVDLPMLPRLDPVRLVGVDGQTLGLFIPWEACAMVADRQEPAEAARTARALADDPEPDPAPAPEPVTSPHAAVPPPRVRYTPLTETEKTFLRQLWNQYPREPGRVQTAFAAATGRLLSTPTVAKYRDREKSPGGRAGSRGAGAATEED